MKSLCRKALCVTLSFIAICFVTVCPAQAATFCVSDAGQLQGALTQAASNGEDDIIKIQQGTYVGNFVYASYEDNALIIEGGYTSDCASRTIDPANTVLDGNSAGNVLVISTEKATPAKMEGLTLQDGIASNNSGGGLYFNVDGGNLKVSQCVFSDNSAAEGGGVYAVGEGLTLSNNSFTQNSSSSGGGVLVYASKGSLYNNTFAGNSASDGSGGGLRAYASNGTFSLSNNAFIANSASNGSGGGAWVNAESGTLTITNNSFTENSAFIDGGGVYSDCANAILALTGNTFTENFASDGMGGGVCALASSGTPTLTLTGNAFTGNYASDGMGGGVYASACNGILTLSNNTFTENSASNGSGGGVYASAEQETITLTLTNNSFYANQATSEGGAIRAWLYDSDSIARIYNNILWMNAASNGADLWIDNEGDNDFLPSPVELFNNDFDQSAAGTWIKIPFPIDPSNLDKADPLFVDAANGDLHLSAGSPCIDAGNNDAPELPAVDKDGNPRIFGNIVDIGAYEYQQILYVEQEGVCGGNLPCYTSIHEAIATSGSTAIVNIAEGSYDEDFIFDQDKHLTLRGGWDSAFTNQPSHTTVTSMTINNGKIVADNIILN